MKRSTYIPIAFAMVTTLGAVAAFAQPNQTKLGKTGFIALAQETRAGNAVLPAGDYEVRHVSGPAGHFMEFTRVSTDHQVGETGVSPYKYEVIAKVPCTMEALNAAATKTEAELASGRLSGLEIRGENVIHLFANAGWQSANAGL